MYTEATCNSVRYWQKQRGQPKGTTRSEDACSAGNEKKAMPP